MGKQKSIRQRVRSKFNGLCMDSKAITFFGVAVEYCVKNNIKPIDLVLRDHVYPILEKKYGYTEKAMETRLIKSIKTSWTTVGQQKYFDQLGYWKKPTIKKLMIILLDDIYYGKNE